jgi:hypothetical protein
VDWILLVVYLKCGFRESWESGVVYDLYTVGCLEVQWKKGHLGGCFILGIRYCWLCRGTVERGTGARVA